MFLILLLWLEVGVGGYGSLGGVLGGLGLLPLDLGGSLLLLVVVIVVVVAFHGQADRQVEGKQDEHEQPSDQHEDPPVWKQSKSKGKRRVKEMEKGRKERGEQVKKTEEEKKKKKKKKEIERKLA